MGRFFFVAVYILFLLQEIKSWYVIKFLFLCCLKERKKKSFSDATKVLAFHWEQYMM
jgi:hypothetical protein